jgi:broad specificity phosphatase PhoE
MLEFNPPARRRIYLMRHGSVSYFDDDDRPVKNDDVSLNETGIAQARAAGDLFGRHGVVFDHVIVSGLRRTIETAQHVLERSGQKAGLEVWPDLREMRSGDADSVPDAALRHAFLGPFQGMPDETHAYLGGETVGQLLDRVHAAVDRLRADADWQVALLVLHGGVNRAILSYALTARRMMLSNLLQAPACVNVLDVGTASHDWIVRAVNVHISDLLQPDVRGTAIEGLFEQYLRGRRRG